MLVSGCVFLGCCSLILELLFAFMATSVCLFICDFVWFGRGGEIGRLATELKRLSSLPLVSSARDRGSKEGFFVCSLLFLLVSSHRTYPLVCTQNCCFLQHKSKNWNLTILPRCPSYIDNKSAILLWLSKSLDWILSGILYCDVKESTISKLQCVDPMSMGSGHACELVFSRISWCRKSAVLGLSLSELEHTM